MIFPHLPLSPGFSVGAGAVLIGVAASAWGKLRFVFSRLLGLAVVRVTVEGDAATALQAWCWATLRRSPTGERRYDSNHLYVRPLARYQVIGFERMGVEPVLFWRGWRPLLVGAAKPASSDGMPVNPSALPNDSRLTVSFLRGTYDPDAMVGAALARHNDHFKIGQSGGRRFHIERCAGAGRNAGSEPKGVGREPTSQPPASSDPAIMRVLGWAKDEIGPPLADNRAALDGLSFPESVMEIVREIKHWRDSEAWYKVRQIPWRRGLLLHGKPGTGKTSLVRAVAEDLDLPLYVYDLASLSNGEMIEQWRRAQHAAPCVALIEDLDAVFEGRTNRIGRSGGGLTFDCLLNCLSGVEVAGGVFVVVTTNNPASLDPALGVPRPGAEAGLSTRPGRLDRAVELPGLDEACRVRIARRILSDCPDLVTPLVVEGDGDTPAQFVERCARVALADYWGDGERMRIPA